MNFSEDEFYQFFYKKHYTNVDVMAFIGGLLGMSVWDLLRLFLVNNDAFSGLFAGLSALSVIELFYFFTIRPLIDRCRSKVQPIHSQKNKEANFLTNFMKESTVHSFRNFISEDSKLKKWSFSWMRRFENLTLLILSDYFGSSPSFSQCTGFSWWLLNYIESFHWMQYRDCKTVVR